MTRKLLIVVCLWGATISSGNTSTLTAYPNSLSGVWESVQVDTAGMHVISVIQFFQDGSFFWEMSTLQAPVTLIEVGAGMPRQITPSMCDMAWSLIGTWDTSKDSLSLTVSHAEMRHCEISSIRIVATDATERGSCVREENSQSLAALQRFMVEVVERRGVTFLYRFGQYDLSFHRQKEGEGMFTVARGETPFSTANWLWNRIYEPVD